MRDEAVVGRVLGGDRDAYAMLVDRYTAMVFGVAGRYARDEAETEDLAQDIFIRAYRGLSGFRSDASFSSWLYRIAVNRCRDHAKSARSSREERMAHPALEAAASLRDPSGAGRTPEAEFERRALGARLRAALEELDPAHAVPFLMRYEERLSYREMAGRLGATEGSLKVRVHRARKTLRDLLGEEA